MATVEIVQESAKEKHEWEAMYTKITNCVKQSHKFPSGASRRNYTTYSSFLEVNDKLNDISLDLANKFMQLTRSDGKYKPLKLTEDETNMDKIINNNDTVLDEINVNIEVLSGRRLPDGIFNEPKVINHKTVKAKNWVPLDLCQNKPQDNFMEKVDNSESIWKPKMTYKHNAIMPFTLEPINVDDNLIAYKSPYEPELRILDCSQFYEHEELDMPPPVDPTAVTFISTVTQLKQLLEHLKSVKTFGIDLEHHDYRSYLGLTCLMQITTFEKGDFIIDVIELRQHTHILNEVFSNGNILKIFHGAKCDILWLQRDFNIYVVEMFDTYEAAKVLNFSRHGLVDIIKHYCNISIDKTHQLHDWRLRPLDPEIIQYAQTDTHYLIYLYAKMTSDINKISLNKELIEEVFERSKHTCLQYYKKPVLNIEYSLNHFMLTKINDRQRNVLKSLLIWRDNLARTLDESCQYIMPKSAIIKIINSLPNNVLGLNRCFANLTKDHLIHQKFDEIFDIVKEQFKQPIANKKVEVPSLSVTDIPHEVYTETHLPTLLDSYTSKEKYVPEKDNSHCNKYSKKVFVSPFQRYSIKCNSTMTFTPIINEICKQ